MLIPFRLRIWPLLATLALVALGVALGQWQSRRAAEKQAVADQIRHSMQAPAFEFAGAAIPVPAYRQLRVRGRFVSEWPVYLENRPWHGQAGFYAVMPFRIDGSPSHILVARGWLARDPQVRTRLPPLATPEQTIELLCVTRPHFERLLQLGQAAPLQPGAIVQNLEPAEIAQRTGWTFHPFVCEQISALPDGLLRDWPAPALGIDKHRAYAFQWYALALLALVFFVVTGVRNGKNR